MFVLFVFLPPALHHPLAPARRRGSGWALLFKQLNSNEETVGIQQPKEMGFSFIRLLTAEMFLSFWPIEAILTSALAAPPFDRRARLASMKRGRRLCRALAGWVGGKQKSLSGGPNSPLQSLVYSTGKSRPWRCIPRARCAPAGAVGYLFFSSLKSPLQSSS